MAEEEKKSTEEDQGVEDQSKDDTTGKDQLTQKNESGSDDKKSSVKTFTQEQVTKMMTREKNQGKASVYNEFGIDPKDTKTVAMFKAFVESQKTEEQKQQEKQSAEANKIEEANQKVMVAEAKVQAMQLGVSPKYVDDIVTLAVSQMTDGADLKTIIGEYKTKYPSWFEESNEDDKNNVGKKGTGSSVKAAEKKNGAGKDSLGARLAAQRKASTKKSTYWNH